MPQSHEKDNRGQADREEGTRGGSGGAQPRRGHRVVKRRASFADDLRRVGGAAFLANQKECGNLPFGDGVPV